MLCLSNFVAERKSQTRKQSETCPSSVPLGGGGKFAVGGGSYKRPLAPELCESLFVFPGGCGSTSDPLKASCLKSRFAKPGHLHRPMPVWSGPRSKLSLTEKANRKKPPVSKAGAPRSHAEDNERKNRVPGF